MKHLLPLVLVCLGLVGCATNGNQSAGSQTITNDVTAHRAELMAPAKFGSTRFFREFGEKATQSSQEAFEQNANAEAIEEYIYFLAGRNGFLDQARNGFLGSDWKTIGYNVLQDRYSSDKQQIEWEFLHVERRDGYVHSYFAVHISGHINYLNVVWSENSETIVEMHKVLYKYGELEALVSIDQLLESEQYSQIERSYFRHTMQAINRSDFQQFKIRFKELPDDLKSHPLLIDNLVQIAATDTSGILWNQLIRELAREHEPHSQYYKHYLISEQDEKALEALDTLPEFIQRHAGVLIERAAIYYDLDQMDKATLMANQAIINDPYLVMPYVVKLMVALKSDDSEGALLTLQVLKLRFEIEYDKAGLQELEGADRFLKTSFAEQYFG
ncbi:hypothetical protein ACFSJ3_18050 [Corallincola platygyrae]|uniref:Uncharacterized protein n=1 Tax=Corallincola platygyrae TaxID=1193278 RepID=A0ABW4XVF5_9GAMM